MASVFDVQGRQVKTIEEAQALASGIEVETRRGWWQVNGDLSSWYFAEPCDAPGPQDPSGRVWYCLSWGARIPDRGGWRLPTSDRDTEEGAAAAARLTAIVEDED